MTKFCFWKHVKVLRTELARLQKLEEFELPPDYFFVHNYNVLDDKMSFLDNFIDRDDEIEIVNGCMHLVVEKLNRLSEVHIPTCRFSPLMQA